MAPTIPPWGWKNPLKNKMAANALLSTKTAAIQEMTSGGSDFTTTDTTNYQDVLNVAIDIPQGHMALFIWSDFLFQHAVAGATFDARITVAFDSAESGSYAIVNPQDIYVAASGVAFPFTVSMGLDVMANLPLVVPGPAHQIRLQVKNNTSGTLTLKSSMQHLYAMVIGDSSR